MSNVVPFPGGQIPALSDELDRAVSDPAPRFFGPRESAEERRARLQRGDDAPGMVLGDYSTAVRAPTRQEVAEARDALSAIETALVPLAPAELQREAETFLGLINIAVANPQDAKALQLREKALWMACTDLPRCAWSQDATRAALSRFKFFPSVAEVMVLLNEHVTPYREKAARLRQVLNRAPGDAVEKRREPTEAERAAVAAQMEALRCEREARETEEARVREFGAYMPGNDATLRGWDLIRALEADLSKMTGGMRDFTVERIAVLKVAVEAADALLEDAKNA